MKNKLLISIYSVIIYSFLICSIALCQNEPIIIKSKKPPKTGGVIKPEETPLIRTPTIKSIPKTRTTPEDTTPVETPTTETPLAKDALSTGTTPETNKEMLSNEPIKSEPTENGNTPSADAPAVETFMTEPVIENTKPSTDESKKDSESAVIAVEDPINKSDIKENKTVEEVNANLEVSSDTNKTTETKTLEAIEKSTESLKTDSEALPATIEKSTDSLKSPEKEAAATVDKSTDSVKTEVDEASITVEKSAESANTFSIEIKNIELEEKMPLDVEIPAKEVLGTIYDTKSRLNDPILQPDKLHNEYGTYMEKSYIRKDLIAAATYPYPPENYIYIYELDDPAHYKNWQFQIVNSKGKQVIASSGRSIPPKKFIWDGYDSTGKWKVKLGEHYSLVFKAADKKLKETIFLEEAFVADSYIIDTGPKVIIRFTTISIFDEQGLQLTSSGKKKLQKICYKMKSTEHSDGYIDIRSNNKPLAKLQIEKVTKFLKENRFNFNNVTSSITSAFRDEDHFEIVLTKKL
ncbi:MAG: hypothetical protein ABII27_05485 [bacterium]